MTGTPAPRAAANPDGESSNATASLGKIFSCFQRPKIDFGVRLDGLDVLFANDRLEGAGQSCCTQDGLDVLAPGAGDDRQADASLELPDQFDHARVNPWRSRQQADRERLLAADPFFDLDGRDAAAGEQVLDELTVVDLRRGCRHEIGHLPAEGRERPLPGRDVKVFRVGDHAIEVEEDGFGGHGFWYIK